MYTYLSYRDPNLLKTVEEYDGTPNFLRTLELDKDALTKVRLLYPSQGAAQNFGALVSYAMEHHCKLSMSWLPGGLRSLACLRCHALSVRGNTGHLMSRLHVQPGMEGAISFTQSLSQPTKTGWGLRPKPNVPYCTSST